MGLTNKGIEFFVIYDKEEVLVTVEIVVGQMKGFKIKSVNDAAGIVRMSTGTSATSWGEDIVLVIKEDKDYGCTININSASKTGALAGGALSSKNQTNIDLLVDNIVSYLEDGEIKSKGGSDKSALLTLFLAIFLGWLGIHRFYLGKTGTGILYLLTLGVFGFGVILDIIRLIIGRLSDKEGELVTNW